MNKQEQIIQFLKESYPRDTRKQLIKSILFEEKSKNVSKDIYKILNQIFSYVLKESSWDMAKNSKDWDASPLQIMEEVFPKIKTTKWYKEQIILTNNSIELIQN